MSKTGRGLTLGLLILAILGVFGVKAIINGWLQPQPLGDLSQGPVLLFFNGSRGCECEVFVYRNAEAQIAGWTEVERGNIPIQQISIHRKSTLREEYQVVRGPTLLLLDPSGQVFWRQDNVVSDLKPFDLAAFELKIWELLDEP